MLGAYWEDAGRVLVPDGSWGRERWLVGDTSVSHTSTFTLFLWRFMPSSFLVEEVLWGPDPPKEPGRGAGGPLLPGRC